MRDEDDRGLAVALWIGFLSFLAAALVARAALGDAECRLTSLLAP